GRKPSDLLQLLLGRGERRAGKDDSANRMHVSDPGEPRRAMPAVDRQGQRAAHPGIVKWLSLVVGLDDPAAVPIALLHGDLVAQRAYQLVGHGWWKPAKLDRCTIAADCLYPDCLLIRIDAGKPIEVGQPFLVVVGVLYSLDRLSGFDRSEFERARSQDVLLIPAGILVEDLFLVDPAEGVGERRQQRSGREFQVKHDGCRVERLDRV